jgi:hypothetical protein
MCLPVKLRAICVIDIILLFFPPLHDDGPNNWVTEL